MTDASSSDPIIRRLEALERATEKRLDDARDIHRREHEAWEDAHNTYHHKYEHAHQALHDKAEQTAKQLQSMYEQRFVMEKESRDDARQQMDKRLEGMNEFRDQLRQQAGTFVTIAAQAEYAKAMEQRFADVTRHTDARYEDNRKRVEALEKIDVKSEGRGLGQSATIAVIIGSMAFVGTVLGIVIALANLATGTP